MASKKKAAASNVQTQQEQLVDIRRFDPEQMRKHKIILIIGPQYSGKSWLLKDLLYYNNPSFPVLVNPNEFNGFFGGVLPKQCKLREIDNDWLEKFCSRQTTLLEFNKQNRRNLDCGAGLIMDHFTGDLTTRLKWHLNPRFNWLFQSGKEASTSMYVTSPYPVKLPPHYLAAVDYVFMLRETNKSNKKRLFADFGGMFGTFENFEDIFDQCTINYRALVVDRTKRASQISDQVFWYRAPKRPRQFRVGSPKLWGMCYNTSVSLDDLLTKPLMLFEASSKRRSRRDEEESARKSQNPYAHPPRRLRGASAGPPRY